MNYKKHYNLLIKRAIGRKLTEYTENHHIIPRCISGNDEEYNLVRLTPREHFVAHLLLVKIYPENRNLIYAVQMMCVISPNHKENRINNRLYGWLRNRFGEQVSLDQTGKGNSQYGTCWIHNLNLKESKKIPKEDLDYWISEGWTKGRKLKFSIIIGPKNCSICKVCDKPTLKMFSNYCDKCRKQQRKKWNHSEDTKKKLKNTHKKNKHQKGPKNSMYGTCWIYCLGLKETRCIPKSDLQKWINDGWLKGRKLKFE